MNAMFAVLVALSSQATDEAEQRFKRMEEKLANARTVECVVEMKMEDSQEGSDSKLDLQGSWLQGERNRERLELKERGNEGVSWHLWVSDGSHALLAQKGSDRAKHDVPKNHNAERRTAFARVGLFLPLMPLPPAPVVTDSKERFRLSDFRLGGKEKVGTQETQRIECQLSVKGQDLPLSVTVWLDQKTELPVRRLVICRTPGGGMFKFTESYSHLVLDEKVDTKQFELPK